MDTFCLAMFGTGLVLIGIECVALALDAWHGETISQKEFAKRFSGSRDEDVRGVEQERTEERTG